MKMNTTGMRRLIPYLKKYRFKITGAILLIVAASCLIALSPTLEGMITTQLFQDVTAGHGVDFHLQLLLPVPLNRRHPERHGGLEERCGEQDQTPAHRLF